MTYRKRVIMSSILFVVIAIPGALIYVGPKLMDGIDDAYAQWGAADMVIDYMRAHNGEWPPDWESLEPYFADGNGRVGGWSFERFKSHIRIDFTVDAAELRRASLNSDRIPFDVIGATSPWASQFEGGPNEIIHRFFRDRGRYGYAASRTTVPDEPSDARETSAQSVLNSDFTPRSP